MMFQLSEEQSLATDRLTDLETLQKEHQKILKDNEQLKMDVSFYLTVIRYYNCACLLVDMVSNES